MSDECLMKQETVFSFYVVYQAVMRKFTLARKATHTGRIVICILLPRVILWTMEEPPSWGAMTASKGISMFIPHTAPS